MPSHPVTHPAAQITSRQASDFDRRDYLLDRYGLRMTKRDLVFESKKCRASIDNMRNPHHPTCCEKLRKAEVPKDVRLAGRGVLFYTELIAQLLGGDDW